MAVAAEGPEAGRHGAGRAQPRPSCADDDDHGRHGVQDRPGLSRNLRAVLQEPRPVRRCIRACVVQAHPRSEEHTSELQSLMRISYAVFCLKKKIKSSIETTILNCDDI